jgi:hypothetical protein
MRMNVMAVQTDLSIIKEIIEMTCEEKVKLIFAEKPGWLLMKTADKNKGIGAIRLNKNSFITLYVDTNEGYLLEDKITELETFKGKIIDINSKVTGNFVQNKIKLYSEDAIEFAIELINKVFNEGAVFTGKRIRVSKTETSVA